VTRGLESLQLDPRQFGRLDDAGLNDVRELEARLTVHLIVYASGAAVAPGGHLCHVLKPARLSARGLSEVEALARRLGPGAVVVAYAKGAQ
jgi:hypothetical protein